MGLAQCPEGLSVEGPPKPRETGIASRAVRAVDRMRIHGAGSRPSIVEMRIISNFDEVLVHRVFPIFILWRRVQLGCFECSTLQLDCI
jgi:hypothetical protein